MTAAAAFAAPMGTISEQRLFDALATISRAFADGGVPGMPGADAAPQDAPADPSPAISAMDDEAKEVLGEAALAVAFGAFAARGGDGGPMHTLVATLGLLAVAAGEEPDPPAEILGIAAEDARVEAEIDRAGEALDGEFGREAPPDALCAVLEARIIGTAVTLAGCTLPEDVDGQAAVRTRAARVLTRLAAGLLAMNAAGGAMPQPPPAGQPIGG